MSSRERLAVRLGHVGERAVGVGMILLQMVERGVERRLIAVAHDFREERVEARFPEAILDAAAGREQCECEADELVGIRGKTFGDSRAHMCWNDQVQRTFDCSRYAAAFTGSMSNADLPRRSRFDDAWSTLSRCAIASKKSFKKRLRNVCEGTRIPFLRCSMSGEGSGKRGAVREPESLAGTGLRRESTGSVVKKTC